MTVSRVIPPYMAARGIPHYNISRDCENLEGIPLFDPKNQVLATLVVAE